MKKTTEIQQQEITQFKNLVSIIKNNEYKAISESGLVNKNELSDNNFNESVYDALLDKLLLVSQTHCTPVYIDSKILPQDDNSFAIAKMENEDKNYTMLKLYDSKTLTGYVVVSDHGDLITYAVSDEGVILDFKEDTITSNSLFKQIEEHAMDNFEYDENEQEHRINAALHYYDLSKESDFLSKEHYLKYKTSHLVDAICYGLDNVEDTSELENYDDELSAEDISANAEHSSYMIFHRALLIATDKKVFVIDHENDTLTSYKHGKEFEFRDTTYTAHPEVLKVVDSVLYGDEKFEHFHKPEKTETEHKKSRTIKPS